MLLNKPKLNQTTGNACTTLVYLIQWKKTSMQSAFV